MAVEIFSGEPKGRDMTEVGCFFQEHTKGSDVSGGVTEESFVQKFIYCS